MKRKLHVIDCNTYFCTRCGQAASDIIDKGLMCSETDNVVGITHLVRGKRLLAFVDPTIPRLS